MPIKSVKMKISKNKKMRFFLVPQGSLNPKIRFLGQKVFSVAHVQTHRQKDTKVNIEDTLSGFQEFFLQSFIKDRYNTRPYSLLQKTYRLNFSWFNIYFNFNELKHAFVPHTGKSSVLPV